MVLNHYHLTIIVFISASVIVIITPISAIIGGFIMDSIGRVNMLKLATLPLIIGWVLIATAVNVPMIIIGRLFVGFGSSKYDDIIFGSELEMFLFSFNLIHISSCSLFA